MLMTKKMFCQCIVADFKYNENKLNCTDEELIPYIFSSTRLGIALVELGIITKENHPEEYNYISERRGIIFEYYNYENNDTYFISVRDILAMLPDEINTKENDEK